MSQQSAPVTIFTHGNCHPNPGLGAYAAILQTDLHGHRYERVLQGVVDNANNQRTELTAVAEALESLKRPCDVIVYADSAYVVKGMTQWLFNWLDNGWLTTKGTPVKHADLWQRIHEACLQHDVDFRWAKAEDDYPQRERLDQLIQQARSDHRAKLNAQRPYRLLLGGSRHASANMLKVAERAVHHAIANNWEIIVGDNPEGVDAAVVAAANAVENARVIVVGIDEKPRNGGVVNGRYIQIGQNYGERDQLMVRASDRGFFIWDGQSFGTRAAHHYMTFLGKQADLYNFAQTF